MNKFNEKELNTLFIELKHNNKIAFEKLYEKYNKLIYGIAFSILKNKEDAEDIVQIVFSKIYQIDKNKLPVDKEASWLYSVTKNEAISFLRKKNNVIDLENIYEIEDDNNEINDIIDKVEFNRLIRGLNDKEKQIISLKILANLSFEEIGKLLNEPTGTIKWRYYKSIHTLKILLSNLGMFIITFAIGIKTLFNKNISNKAEQEQETIKDNQIEQNQEDIEEEATKSEIQESLKDETYRDNESIKEDIKEEITIQKELNVGQINYYGVGILSLSLIFFSITISFLIFFIKYQLKRKKKASKY